MGRKVVSQCSGFGPGNGVAGHAGRFIQHEKYLVLVKNLDSNIGVRNRELFQPEYRTRKGYGIARK
jgi:hypothetical protein